MVTTTINAETAETAETSFPVFDRALVYSGQAGFCVFRLFCVDRRGLTCCS
jgi:hypothetical protein